MLKIKVAIEIYILFHIYIKYMSSKFSGSEEANQIKIESNSV